MLTYSPNPRLPDISDRLVLIGGTGSGKTVAGLWHLSRQPIESMPWLVIDYKGDELITGIPHAQHVPIGTPLLNGVYVIHPLLSDKEALEKQLWDIWKQEDTGVFVDEGFMLADSEAFNTLLMQGRSKHIPVIVLTQRPVFVSRFIFSEASFIQVFRVIDKRDRKTISEFTPIFQEKDEDELPPRHSYYYDVGEHKLSLLKPVPDPERTNQVFEVKLKPEDQRAQRVFL